MKVKVKLEHFLENGNKVAFEGFLEAEDLNAAQKKGLGEFQAALKNLASASSISIEKAKVEFGHEHH
ncbi:MAG: hypothetical protein M5U26_30290 [Planctomycetota bacterium]|nr:hypothetical protein [Planctomycetota bacterium]